MLKQLENYLLEEINSISSAQISDFKKYHDLIIEWNKKINLISKADESHIVERHFLESIIVLTHVDIHKQAVVLDIGSGGGFPAIPVALLRRDLAFFLIESKRKKTLFLKDVIAKLKLKNIFFVCKRCENLSEENKYIKFFDFVFCRAVGKLDLVYGWSKDLIKPKGVFVFWKGGKIKAEILHLIERYENISVKTIELNDHIIQKKRDKKLVLVQHKCI